MDITQEVQVAKKSQEDAVAAGATDSKKDKKVSAMDEGKKQALNLK